MDIFKTGFLFFVVFMVLFLTTIFFYSLYNTNIELSEEIKKIHEISIKKQQESDKVINCVITEEKLQNFFLSTNPELKIDANCWQFIKNNTNN